jgi:hypothetical protein
MAQGKSAAKAVVDKTKELVAEYGKVSLYRFVFGMLCARSCAHEFRHRWCWSQSWANHA